MRFSHEVGETGAGVNASSANRTAASEGAADDANTQKQVVSFESQKKQATLTQEISRGNVPELELVSTTAKLEDQAGIARLNYLQSNILERHLPDLVEHYYKNGGAKVKERLQAKLREESDPPSFGPTTQTLYMQYVHLLQAAVEADEKALTATNLSPPPGSPFEAKAFLAKQTQLPANFGMDLSGLPSDDDLDKLDNVKLWHCAALQVVLAADEKARTKNIETLITEKKYPQDWLKHQDYNTDAWSSSVQRVDKLIDVYSRYVIAAQELNKICSTQIPMPLNTTIEDKVENGKPAKQLNVGLPKDLHLENPATAHTFNQMQLWLQKNMAQIDKEMRGLEPYVKDERTLVSWGDTELHTNKPLLAETLNSKLGFAPQVQARFDHSGNFLGLAVFDPTEKRKYEPKEGEHLDARCNLLRTDFEVSQAKGQIIVDQTVQAQHAVGWGGHNFVTDSLGNPTHVGSRSYDPEDYVAVQEPIGIRLIKAKELESYKLSAKGWHYGGKAMSVGLDLTMAATGTIEAYEALMLINAGKLAGDKALSLTLREALLEASKAGLKTSVGLLGAFDNAGARDTALGAIVDKGRQLYFLGDIALGATGAAKDTWKSTRQAESIATKELSSAEKVRAAITASGENSNELLRARLAGTYAAAQNVSKFTEYGVVIQTAKDVRDIVQTTSAAHDKFALIDALNLYGRGEGSFRFLRLENDSTSTSQRLRSLEAARNFYVNETTDRSRSSIERMFDVTKDAIASNDPKRLEQANEEIVQQIAANFFNGRQRLKLESTHGSELSTEQLFELLDEQRRNEFGKENDFNTRRFASFYASKFNPIERSAALICLADLSRSKDDRLPQELASFRPRQGESQIDKYSTGDFRSLSIDQSVLVAALAPTLDLSLHSPAEAAAAGNFLYSLGVIGARQYCAIARGLFGDPRTSRELKIDLLSGNGIRGLGPAIRTITDEEAKPGRVDLPEQTFGVSSIELRDFLKTIAQADSDDDVRAAAASLLFVVNQKGNQYRDSEAHLAKEANELAEAEPGRLRKSLNAWLLACSQKSEDEVVGIKAAQALALSTKPSDYYLNGELVNFTTHFVPTQQAFLVLTNIMDESKFKSNLHFNRQATYRFLAASIDKVKLPDPSSASNYQDEATLIDFIDKLAPLVQDGQTPYKSQLAGRLHQLVNPESGASYALNFPRLRAAAINALAVLHDRTCEELIKQQLGLTEFTGGGLKIGADPSVRLAAIRYFKELDSKALRSLKANLTKNEKDPAVYLELQSISGKGL